MDSCIMSSPFFNPQTIDLAFSTEAPGIRRGQLVAFDIYGNVLLRAKSSSFSSKHFILDADSDNPLLTLKSKYRTAHARWQVFNGNGLDAKDLLFSIKQTSILQFRSEYDVFFAENTEEEVCDCKIKGSFHRRELAIHKGDSIVIAQMSKEHRVETIPLGKHAFGVTIKPGIDVLFVAAIVVILFELEQQQYLAGVAGVAGAVAAPRRTVQNVQELNK